MLVYCERKTLLAGWFGLAETNKRTGCLAEPVGHSIEHYPIGGTINNETFPFAGKQIIGSCIRPSGDASSGVVELEDWGYRSCHARARNKESAQKLCTLIPIDLVL